MGDEQNPRLIRDIGTECRFQSLEFIVRHDNLDRIFRALKMVNELMNIRPEK